MADNCNKRNTLKGGKDNIRRFRTVDTAHKALIMLDKDTPISKYMIRTWCDEGKVYNVWVGNKMLVDLDDLIDKINNLV